MMNYKGSIAAAVMMAALCISWNAAAQECYRNADCDGQDLCVSTVCTPSGEALDTCETDPDCEESGWRMLCDDGYCKMDGVTCASDAGHCNMDASWSHCVCAAGDASDGESEGEPPEYTDEELYAQCVELLELDCGTEAPDPADECTDTQLADCTAYYGQLVALYDACGDEYDGPEYLIITQCCDDFADAEEDGDTEWQVFYDCVMALTAETCADLEACYSDEDGESGGDFDDQDGGANEEDATGSDSSGGACSAAPRAAETASLLVALLRGRRSDAISSRIPCCRGQPSPLG